MFIPGVGYTTQSFVPGVGNTIMPQTPQTPVTGVPMGGMLGGVGGVSGLMSNPAFMGGLAMLLSGMQKKRYQTPLQDLMSGMGMAGALQQSQRQKEMYEMQKEEFDRKKRLEEQRQQALVDYMQGQAEGDMDKMNQAALILEPEAFIKEGIKEPPWAERRFGIATEGMTPEQKTRFARDIALRPQTVIKQEMGSIPAGMRRVPDPTSPTKSRLVYEPGAPTVAKTEDELSTVKTGLKKAQEIIDFIDTYGAETGIDPTLTSDEREEISRIPVKREAIIAMLAILENKGVLQEGERAALEGQLADPTSSYSYFKSKAGMKGAYIEVIDRAKDILKQKADIFGVSYEDLIKGTGIEDRDKLPDKPGYQVPDDIYRMIQEAQ